jgi:hypothetical protein
MSNSRYNPFSCALSAAFKELTSDRRAQQYYSVRAQQDIQNTIIFAFQICTFVYAFGAQCRELLETVESNSSNTSNDCLSIVPTPLTRTLQIFPDIFIEPVKVLSISPVQPKALPIRQPIALLPSAKNSLTFAVNESAARFSMTAKELRALAKHKGVRGYPKMSKTTLLSLLTI